MATFEYKCHECGQEFEVERRISDTSDQDCPACGFETCQRLISRTSFQLRGTGWYRDGYDVKERKWLETFKPQPDTGESTKVAEYLESSE